MAKTKSRSTKKARTSNRRPSRSSKVPVQRTLRFEVTNSGNAGTETSHYIDLGRELSAVNRRLYRQGLVYKVQRVIVVSTNTLGAPGGSAGFVSLSTVPNTWVTRGAWRYGQKTHRMMQDEAMRGLPNASAARGPWTQFIVSGMDSATPAPTYLRSLDNGGNNATLGEWTATEFHSPDGTTSSDAFKATILGGHVGSAGSRSYVSLVEAFGESRATLASPQPTQPANMEDSPLANVFDHGTNIDEVLTDIQTDGDEPPYSLANYSGGASNQPKPVVQAHGSLGADGAVVLGGFEAVCGLIEVEVKSPVAGDVYSILVELAPGSHRGVAAEAI